MLINGILVPSSGQYYVLQHGILLHEAFTDAKDLLLACPDVCLQCHEAQRTPILLKILMVGLAGTGTLHMVSRFNSSITYFGCITRKRHKMRNAAILYHNPHRAHFVVGDKFCPIW